jgi:SAM-dependent methyltransferase
MGTLQQLVGDKIPNDHARQVHSRYYLRQALTASNAHGMMLDLGCGNGSSAPFAQECNPDVKWVGVDIMRSDAARKVDDFQVIMYDGVNLPFRDNSVPLVYSNQVLEHVRHPEPLLGEVRRILEPGGVFIGSTSQLEPYHAWSLWNFTVYGFSVLVEDAGLTLEEVRPGIDGVSLIQRQWFGRRKEHGEWFKLSPLNIEIDQSTPRSTEPAAVNLRKLQFAGHFSFRVRKAGAQLRSLPPKAEDGDVSPAAEDSYASSPRIAPMVPLGAPPTPAPPPPQGRVRVVSWARKQARRATIPKQRG